MKNKKAFTLIELMVVMAIIAVLAVLIIGAIILARRTSTETTHRSNAKSTQTALEGYYASNKKYPFDTNVSESCQVAYARGGSAGTLTGSSCAAAGADDGGCHVTYTTIGYTIFPMNFNCSNPLGETDWLSVK
jgi:prepilin-type N-terminal cleavage/methylation domain-containing protein